MERCSVAMEDFLEKIYETARQAGHVRVSDLAARLAFKPPTVNPGVRHSLRRTATSSQLGNFGQLMHSPQTLCGRVFLSTTVNPHFSKKPGW